MIVLPLLVLQTALNISMYYDRRPHNCVFVLQKPQDWPHLSTAKPLVLLRRPSAILRKVLLGDSTYWKFKRGLASMVLYVYLLILITGSRAPIVSCLVQCVVPESDHRGSPSRGQYILLSNVYEMSTRAHLQKP